MLLQHGAAVDAKTVENVTPLMIAAAHDNAPMIGLLGTAATIRQSYVDRLEHEYAAGKRLIRHAAPELVAAVPHSLALMASRPRFEFQSRRSKTDDDAEHNSSCTRFLLRSSRPDSKFQCQPLADVCFRVLADCRLSRLSSTSGCESEFSFRVKSCPGRRQQRRR